MTENIGGALVTENPWLPPGQMYALGIEAHKLPDGWECMTQEERFKAAVVRGAHIIVAPDVMQALRKIAA